MDLARFAIQSRVCLSVNSWGTDKEYNHLYLSHVYGPLFNQVTPMKRILEIGIGGGYSADLWLNYLSPDLLFLVDVNLIAFNNLASRKLPKVQLVLGDAYSHAVARKMPTQLDLVIDDGPHSYWSLKAVIRLYLAKIRPGGTLVVEDIPSIEDVLDKLLLSTNQNLVCCTWLIDLRQEARLKDDSVALVIHRKGGVCNLKFDKGIRVSAPNFLKTFSLKCVLLFERCTEFLSRKVYLGVKFRLEKLLNFCSNTINRKRH